MDMRAVMTIAAAIIASAALAWEAPLPRVSGVEVSGGGSVVESGVNPGYAANADKALMVDTYDPSSASRPGIAADAMLTRDMVRQYRRSDEKVNWEDVTNHAEFVTEEVTNGLASTNFVYAQNYVTEAVTNGLASTNYVYKLATSRYTKAETDEKLAGKVSLNPEEEENGYINVVGSISSTSGDGYFASGVTASTGDITTYLRGGEADRLSEKANRAESGDADEIATLDADGNPTRSGIVKDDVVTKDDLDDYLPLTGGELSGGIYARQSLVSDIIIAAPTVDTVSIRLGSQTYYLINEDECLADDNGKFAHVSDISADSTAFSNAVNTVARDLIRNAVKGLDASSTVEQLVNALKGIGN